LIIGIVQKTYFGRKSSMGYWWLESSEHPMAVVYLSPDESDWLLYITNAAEFQPS